MQIYLPRSGAVAQALAPMQRKLRAVLPLLLAPCVPAVVACSTADVRAEGNAPITPDVVARVGLPPLLLRPLNKSDAVALNRTIPFSAEPVVPALPFEAGKVDMVRARALDCLTSAIYYEASGETDDGERAVAQVILNRVRHPAFPASVCGVVYQGATLRTGCQFSFTCDGSLQRVPGGREWDRARSIAAAALAGAVYAPVGLATHYHADYVVPYWASSLAKSAQIGAHIFYRWPGAWGRPPSFTQHYGVAEADPAALRNLALLSHGQWPAVPLPDKPRLALSIDPKVELAGIVRMLTVQPAAAHDPIEKMMRGYFEPHRGAALFAALQPASVAPVVDDAKSATPATPAPVDGQEPAKPTEALTSQPVALSLPQLIADFSRQANFPGFLRSREALYRTSMTGAAQAAERAAVDWETYTGVAVAGGKAVLSLSDTYGAESCVAPAASRVPVIRWSAALGPDDIFLQSGLARSGLALPGTLPKGKARQLRAAMQPIESEIVAAVFVRIAAVSRGENVGTAMLSREVGRGNTLVPALTERLRFFEAHRGEYPSLSEFLPVMMSGMPPINRLAPNSEQPVAANPCQPAASAAG